MSAHHVGKQTHTQCSRFCKDSENLYELHDGKRKFKEHRHIRPEYLFPVMLCSKHICQDKHHHSQYKRNSYITRKIRTAGENHDKPHKVHHKNEKETCEKERSKLARFVLQSCLDNTYIDEINKHLHESHAFSRCL